MRRFMSLMLLCVVLAGAVCMPLQARERPLLSTATEQEPPGGVRPSPRLVLATMGVVSANERTDMESCLAEAGRRKDDFAFLLSAARVRGRPGTPLWFVRPTLKPYCMALYGAHIFQSFLFEDVGRTNAPDYRLRYQDDGDAFAVYRHLDHGLNDIESTGCWATGCRSQMMSFDGRAYRPILCTQRQYDDHGRETTRITRHCWSNDVGN